MDTGNPRLYGGTARAALFTLLLMASSPLWALSVFINELHYDNIGADRDEGIEVAGPAGMDLTGWQLLLYNGGNGKHYAFPLTLTGRIPDQGRGAGTLALRTAGIQNGPADGVALVDAQGVLLQFLSYEGVFTAVDGPAAGLASTDIGVQEDGATPLGWSLQLQGEGSRYQDFHWVAAARSFGGVNRGQVLGQGAVIPTPLPGGWLLMLSAVSALLGFSRLRTREMPERGCPLPGPV
ncbi:MAG TPA: lamin tail domain-containing protein [Sedimenticola sp.]|nr:lamin tail domain-containing protein [Sedimenticola sp.]